jgi:hypothetical protein
MLPRPIFFLGLVLFIISALPLLAAPVPRERNRPINLLNTVWISEGDTGFGQTTFLFHDNGKLEYRYGGNTHFGTWKQSGTEFSFELNNRYYWYDGTIHGSKITGKADNKPGGHCEYKLKFQSRSNQ